MKEFLLEACVDSLASAEAAKQGGADRLELCTGLVIGGLTPGLSFFRQVKKRTGWRVHVLIRPRFGDLCYSADEFEMCIRDRSPAVWQNLWIAAAAMQVNVRFLSWREIPR